MINIEYSKIGTKIEVIIEDKNFKCEVIEKPFFDPKKIITSKLLVKMVPPHGLEPRTY